MDRIMKIQPKRVKKEIKEKNKKIKLKVHCHLRKLKVRNQWWKIFKVKMVIVMGCYWKKSLLLNNQFQDKLFQRRF